MMEPREEVLDSPTGRVARPIRHHAETDGVSEYLMDTEIPDLYASAPAFLDAVTKHARRVVYLSLEGLCHHLGQQTDTIIARIAAKRRT